MTAKSGDTGLALPDGFYPFWFWNDRIEVAELRRQIDEMHAKGIRGFFIHSRQGLQNPYLSDSFLGLVEVAISTAEQYGMKVHLYDEYPYPSGAAGGQATLGNPHFHATELVQKTFDAESGPVRLTLPQGKVLACTAHPLTGNAINWTEGIDLRDHVGTILADETYVLMGLTQYNRKRYFASNPVPVLETVLPAGRFKIFVSVQTVVTRHKYWGSFIDVLNPEAVDCFIRLTHERYFKRFGEKFGRSVRSIFVDETAPGWSERIPAAFESAFGCDLLPLLPALQDKSHPSHLTVLRNLQELKHRLFCESFEARISGWCRAHGLQYSGEKPAFRLSQLRFMDIPGCEPGHTKAGAQMDLLQPSIRGNARATASAAYFYGKEGSLCECYHSLGWGATLQDAKVIAEGLLLMGIRYLVPHGFFYSTHALAKHDAPPTFFFQAPYWRLFGHLSSRIEKIADHFADTHIDAQLLVVDPAGGLPSAADLESYRQLMNLLAARRLDFLIVDTGILESGKLEQGAVSILDITAKVILVPPMRFVESALEQWLAAFAKSGGTVIHTGQKPDPAALESDILARVQPSLAIRAVQGDDTRLQMVSRAGNGRRLWFILNTGGSAVDIELSANCALREIPLGGVQTTLSARTDTGTHLRSIQPFESVLLEAGSALSVPAPVRIRVPLSGPLTFRPLGPNLLRMYDWNMSLPGSGEQGQTARVGAVPLINQLDAGHFRFAPAVRHFFGTVPELQLPSLKVHYSFPFINDYSGPVELVMEPGSIKGNWTIRVNNSTPLTSAGFAPSKAHISGSLGLNITQLLRPGVNEICVDVETDRHDGGLRNALYLAGDFAVRTGQDPVLTGRPAAGLFQDLDTNGLPYYAGEIEYKIPFTLNSAPQDILLSPDFGTPFEDACEIAVNNGPWRPAPWSPYEVPVGKDELQAGQNLLRVRVLTTLLRAFEGQDFDITRHAYREIAARA